MITDTEGIILRQIKTVGGRRMLLLFSRKYGKISVGTSIAEGGKSKSALATRPFTYGRYELFKGRDSYNLNNAQVLKSYYAFGEDLDKYMAASYVLELTERLLTEELPQPAIFKLLTGFMESLELRSKKHDTLILAYMVKLLEALGTMPELDECVCCGSKKTAGYFSIKDGGMLCESCAGRMKEQNATLVLQNKQKVPKSQASGTKEALIYSVNFGIVNILKFFKKEPLECFGKIALDDVIAAQLREILQSYIKYHFDIGKLKSEVFLLGEQ